MSKATAERMCPMWGASWTVAPHTYIPTCPGVRGVNSRVRRVAESYRCRVTAVSLSVSVAFRPQLDVDEGGGDRGQALVAAGEPQAVGGGPGQAHRGAGGAGEVFLPLL